jgi:hypothetical protein
VKAIRNDVKTKTRKGNRVQASLAHAIRSGMALALLGSAAAAPGARLRPRPRRLLLRAASSGAPLDPERAAAWRLGVPEAQELWAQAARQAAQATRLELQESLESLSLGSDAPPTEPQAAHAALVRTWREAGAASRGADALATACLAAGGRLATPEGAAAKLSQLRRLLPGQDVVALAQREPRALTLARPEKVVANLCSLAMVLADAGVDPVAFAAQHPALLWADGLDAKLAVCVACLRRWSPRSDPALVLEEFPELLERVPRHYANHDFFELPIDVQNAMAVGGGGGGTHYRSWSGDEQPDVEGDGGEDDQGGWQHSDNNTD